MPIWRIGKIGTSQVTVEEADTWNEACRKAGWESKDCEVADITETVRILMARRLAGSKRKADIIIRREKDGRRKKAMYLGKL